MSENLYALGDCGGTQLRTTIMGESGAMFGIAYGETDVDDYEGTMQAFADTAAQLTDGRGEIVVASMAIAGEVDDGRLVRAGTLTPWVGRAVRDDLANVMGLPSERAVVMNDMVAVGMSQNAFNDRNDWPVEGYVATFSSGLGGAHHGEDGVVADEPGHEFLRAGAYCPCGEEGHTEAYVSGNGTLKNQGVPMKEWLQNSGNQATLVTDIADTVVALIERHDKAGRYIETFRWMGGVAMNQPFVMSRAADAVRQRLGGNAPMFDSVSMGDQAGLHGTFVAAQSLLVAA